MLDILNEQLILKREDPVAFDGHALHHVVLYPRVSGELARVVRHGGQVIFAENWGGNNPLFQLWRYCTVLRKNRSASRGEAILHKEMLDKFRDRFSVVNVEPLSLLYMSKKYLKNPFLLKLLLRLDYASTGVLPFLKDYCGEAVIRLSR